MARKPKNTPNTDPAALATALAPVVAFSPSQLDAKRAELEQACAAVGAIRVTNAAEAEQANRWLVAICQEKDAIEGMRTSVTKPLNGVLRQINGWFKPLTELCTAAEGQLKSAIGAYAAEQRRLQVASYQAVTVAHRAGDHDQARTALAVASSAATETPQGTNVREVWAAEVIAPDLLPRQWLVPDEPAIAKHARETPIDAEPEPIPGVKFTRRPVVTVRRS